MRYKRHGDRKSVDRPPGADPGIHVPRPPIIGGDRVGPVGISPVQLREIGAAEHSVFCAGRTGRRRRHPPPPRPKPASDPGGRPARHATCSGRRRQLDSATSTAKAMLVERPGIADGQRAGALPPCPPRRRARERKRAAICAATRSERRRIATASADQAEKQGARPFGLLPISGDDRVVGTEQQVQPVGVVGDAADPVSRRDPAQDFGKILLANDPGRPGAAWPRSANFLPTQSLQSLRLIFTVLVPGI